MRYVGRYLTFKEFCTCTNTYQSHAEQIDPYPKNIEESLPAIESLCQHVIDLVIDEFGRERFQLTYGFCSTDLKRWLAKKDPVTGLKNGRVSPNLDQHMAHEVNRNGQYYCSRLGAACDFRILDLSSEDLVEWILTQHLPFDSLYYYGPDRPVHVSYGPQQKRDIWTFIVQGTPTKKGIEQWLP
jgi:hypothetical protein